MKLLHVDSSPRAGSMSRRVSRELVSALREQARVEYAHRDLAAAPVPHITQAWTEICDNLMGDGITELGRLHEGARTPAQKEAWTVVEPLLAELVAADVVVVATPMYNYSVPSGLKAWIDQVTFPRMDLAPRRFVVVASRGGSYGPESPKRAFEHQVRYLSDFMAGHFAVEPPALVTVDLVNATVDPLLEARRSEHEDSLRDALASARDLATSLLDERVSS